MLRLPPRARSWAMKSAIWRSWPVRVDGRLSFFGDEVEVGESGTLGLFGDERDREARVERA